MKYIIFVIICIITVSVRAQNVPVSGEVLSKEVSAREERPKVDNLIKNPAAEDVTVQGYVIDKRAAKYYHPGTLENVSLEKAKKINFIYLKSFDILSPEALSEDCLSYMRDTFDTGSYNYLRQWNIPTTITVRWNDCEVSIELYSWEQINQRFAIK